MTTKALTKPISRDQAMFLLQRVWPEAPTPDVLKAAIICTQYDLNPLMKHVALVKFGQKWEPILEIKATRIIAQRKHNYSFEDGPRVMTEDEQKATFGEVDHKNTVVMVVLAEDGRKYPGYGRWPLEKEPYGTEKGNTRFNMAAIRAERNAIDKMAPGEIPRDIEIGDEVYLDPVDIKAQIEKGKDEFIESTEQTIDELWGEDRDVPKTIPELMAWAISHGKQYSPSWVCRELNIDRPEDIDDVMKAFATIKNTYGW